MNKTLVKFTRNHRCLIYPPFTKYKTQHINITTFFFWIACFKEGMESNVSVAPDIGLCILKFNKTVLLFCKFGVIGSANGGVYSNARSERMKTRAFVCVYVCVCVCVCVCEALIDIARSPLPFLLGVWGDAPWCWRKTDETAETRHRDTMRSEPKSYWQPLGYCFLFQNWRFRNVVLCILLRYEETTVCHVTKHEN